MIQPGDLISLKIEEGLEQARTLVLVMSERALTSDWVTLERHTVLFRDPTNQQRRFIPILLDNVEIRGTLKQFAYVDWRMRSEEQYKRLLAACHPVAAEMESVIEQEGKVQPLKVFKGHAGTVWAVAITPDGHSVVSASSDKTIKIWHLASGKCLTTIRTHKRDVCEVKVTSDGRRLISYSDDGTISIWDIATNKCLKVLEAYEDTWWTKTASTGLAITPDGRRIVASYNNGWGNFHIFDLDKNERVTKFDKKFDVKFEGEGVEITPDGKWAIIGDLILDLDTKTH